MQGARWQHNAVLYKAGVFEALWQRGGAKVGYLDFGCAVVSGLGEEDGSRDLSSQWTNLSCL